MKILYGFAYLAVDREDGRTPKIINAEWFHDEPEAEQDIAISRLAGRLARKLARL